MVLYISIVLFMYFFSDCNSILFNVWCKEVKMI